jgi:glyoxylase-like metal-dependent hydrolase (beta-lactamase superfamily II)
MQVKPFFHLESSTFTYVIYDEKTLDALIIDPVLDFDPLTFKPSLTSLKEVISFIEQHSLKPQMVLDTHLHADHLTGAYYLKERLNIPSAIGKNFLISQEYFCKFYEIEKTDAYDLLLEEGQVACKNFDLKVIFTPGHTASCTAFLINNALFCGDTLFNPDIGCGRADFPLGSAQDLFYSIKKIYNLPDSTQIFVGHDYPKDGNSPRANTSIMLSKKQNIMINDQVEEARFIYERQKRDQGLPAPRLMNFAMQVNILGGRLPDFFKIAVIKPSWL